MSRPRMSVVILAATVGLAMPAAADAATYDKLAYLTFSAPVQIPGATLGAGTYRFHLVNPETSRNVIQVLSGDGVTVYSMFHTIPDRRATLTDEPTVTFVETPEGVPPAIRSLFYGGEYRGYEFVWFDGPNMLPPPEWPGPPVRYTPYTTAAPAEPMIELDAGPIVEAVAEQTAPASEPELPKTASALPLLAAGGAASVIASLALGLLRRRRW